MFIFHSLLIINIFFYNINDSVLQLIALYTNELFIGLYCRVISFIISCDTQPPEKCIDIIYNIWCNISIFFLLKYKKK